MLWATEACSKFYRITIFKTLQSAIGVWWQELYPWHLSSVAQTPAQGLQAVHVQHVHENACTWEGQLWAGLPEDAGHTDLMCLVDQVELSVTVLEKRWISNHSHTALNFVKVKKMSLSSFNLMRCSSDHYALIKKPGSIILWFIHQQVGMRQ